MGEDVHGQAASTLDDTLRIEAHGFDYIRGYHVVKCESSDQNVQMLGDDVGIFTHSVLTNVMMNDGETEQREREAIVFRREPDGRWLAVHEHLSPAP
jgi:ketosteroid isomerase-like protein